ncbi:hypothetical protein [Streptomonospora salina]|uniref:Sulfotransferase domain-containing protein n=2 Tax=Streptomonospora salina TaxID=104205 RepID=A0A841E7E2_9ACTN|nr:hypothetical protein [Streptomonospora salina]
MGELPSGTRFLHIGPHKTGTTAIQGAFNLARPRLREHGLFYVGTGRQPVKAAQQATGRPPMFGSAHGGKDHWRNLLDEVEANDDLRPVISSEFFCEADDASARRIVDDLGGSRVHLVVTLRPLSKVLAAQWQQYVQNGSRVPYDEWLEAVFNRPAAEQPNPSFWRRHDHGDLVSRWSAIVGPENMTVIAVDDSDRGMLLRSFEEITDLPDGFLAPDDTQENRSLSYGEAELFRRFNEEFRGQDDWDRLLYGRYIRRGAVRRMKVEYRPSREESVIRTPEWAMARAAKSGSESASAISGLGLRIMGDLAVLSELPKDRVGTPPGDAAVPSEAAAHAVFGAVAAGRDSEIAAKKKAESAARKAVAAEEGAAAVAEKARKRDPERLPNVTSGRLVRELGNRGVRKLRRLRKRVSPGRRSRGSA